MDKLNIPFGFSPFKRLQLIHGYECALEAESNYKDEFETIPYILSEDVFMEFEEKFIVIIQL